VSLKFIFIIQIRVTGMSVGIHGVHEPKGQHVHVFFSLMLHHISRARLDKTCVRVESKQLLLQEALGTQLVGGHVRSG
jgi:hypothetical protein